MVIIFLLGIILNSAAVMMKSTLDQFLGAGEKTVVGASNLDGLYYEQKYTDGEAAKAAGYVIAEQVNAEGSILLKNLRLSSTVTYDTTKSITSGSPFISSFEASFSSTL